MDTIFGKWTQSHWHNKKNVNFSPTLKNLYFEKILKKEDIYKNCIWWINSKSVTGRVWLVQICTMDAYWSAGNYVII